MRYAALLRGINVGGNSRVDMKWLKAICESIGWKDVRTYINSGNIVFTHVSSDTTELGTALKKAMSPELGFDVEVLVKSRDQLQAVIDITPVEWRNDASMKCDAVFVWHDETVAGAMEILRPREGIDEVRTTSDVIIWKVDRENATRNGLLRMMGTPLYKKVTVRNINTIRKLGELLDA